VLESSFKEIKSIVTKAIGENINTELLKLVGQDLLEKLHKTISDIWVHKF